MKQSFTSESLAPKSNFADFLLEDPDSDKTKCIFFQHFTENHKIFLPLKHSYLPSSAGNSLCFSFFHVFPFGAETRALIRGGGCEYTYFRVLPDEFLLKSIVIRVDFKRNSSSRTRRYEYTLPPN